MKDQGSDWDEGHGNQLQELNNVACIKIWRFVGALDVLHSTATHVAGHDLLRVEFQNLFVLNFAGYGAECFQDSESCFRCSERHIHK
jgi:hypothetical protein